MLPELKFTQKTAMDKNLYFNRQLSIFIAENEHTNEPISKYNVSTLRELRELEDILKIQKSKFGIIFAMGRIIKNNNTMGYTRRITHSLKKQTSLVCLLDKRCLKTRLDATWADAIHHYVYEKVTERCERLEKSILPELIKV